jgi:hypothetical protein
VSIFKVFQDLSVLVAEVEMGALIEFQDPNYPLLSGATRTIKTLLNRLISSRMTQGSANQLGPAIPSGSITVQGEEDYIPWTNNGNWDFEMDFWNDLAEHPILVGNEDQPFSFV